ncbi:hypothetical protein [uncultured Lawsonella sp.]|uniref:hypothetical protein n=1 Tax=uncultured Lawsonella sp. TaxID=1847727 RepID=UPI0025D2E69F|nr:hypothetical protein [uncultured Lawsonella sp.]
MSSTVFSFPQVVRGDGAAGGDAVGASQNTIRSGKNSPKANSTISSRYILDNDFGDVFRDAHPPT